MLHGVVSGGERDAYALIMYLGWIAAGPVRVCRAPGEVVFPPVADGKVLQEGTPLMSSARILAALQSDDQLLARDFTTDAAHRGPEFMLNVAATLCGAVIALVRRGLVIIAGPR